MGYIIIDTFYLDLTADRGRERERGTDRQKQKKEREEEHTEQITVCP